ncbi:unnamed protein product [Schistosoma margrebowiei]|uniref:Uncharacterized protein n=1 Tax=Schistosoma margrebowiei TaxID=48269 RepID=A0A183N1J4_9TREM|nr:unnamed protein product [Schistosoma margrebowiei]
MRQEPSAPIEEALVRRAIEKALGEGVDADSLSIVENINTDGKHIRCEIKILKSPRREFESFNVLFCDSQSCSAKHSKSSKINKANKFLDQTIVQSSSNTKFVYDVKCFQITIYDVLNVPKFPKSPIIGPPHNLPESDQDSRQIQPPAQIPIESDVLENAKKLPTQTLPISKNLSSIAAFKNGTLISKEEIQGGVPANKTVASMRDKVREVSTKHIDE